MIEHSRARRAAFEPQPVPSSKSQTPSKKETVSSSRIPPTPPPPPPIPNRTTISQSPLLSKVDVDTVTIEKNTIQRPSLQIISDNIDTIIKSPSTTSQDVTLKLNQTLTKTILSTPSSTIPKHEQDERKDDLNFSITDITD